MLSIQTHLNVIRSATTIAMMKRNCHLSFIDMKHLSQLQCAEKENVFLSCKLQAVLFFNNALFSKMLGVYRY